MNYSNYNFKSRTSSHIFDEVVVIVLGATVPDRVIPESSASDLVVVHLDCYGCYKIGIPADKLDKPVTILKLYDDGESGQLKLGGQRMSFRIHDTNQGKLLYLSNYHQ